MTPQQAAAAARADYTQNAAKYSPSSVPTLGVSPSSYSYTPDGRGGYNFYTNGSTPITREQYASGSGNPYPTNGSSGAGVLGASTSAAAAPAAPANGPGSPAALLSDFMLQKQGALNTAGAQTAAGGAQLGSSIQDLIDSLKGGQRNIDAASVNNDLSKQQGTQSILDMVGNGVRSGGVMLDNKNAQDSSATQALANAYGLLGRQQLSGVGNQFEQGQNKIAADQFNQDQQAAEGSRHITENKSGIINGIVSTAQNSLQMLNAAMAGASLPDRIDIQKEIDTVKNNALGQLQQYDSMLSKGVAGVQAMNPDAARAKAAELAAAGTASPDTFNFSTQVPTQFQGTGPFASSLPLFTLNNKKQQA